MRPITAYKIVRAPGENPKKIEDFKGKFHQWGFELWEQETGDIAISVAIVEREDGQIETVVPTMVRFDDSVQGGAA